MRVITIRQLDRNLFQELEVLPVLVTRYGKPYCEIHKTSLPENKTIAPTLTEYIPPKGATQEDIIRDMNSTMPIPIKKKLDKNGYCPHFVKGDGYCMRCEQD